MNLVEMLTTELARLDALKREQWALQVDECSTYYNYLLGKIAQTRWLLNRVSENNDSPQGS